jgi:hypothetical protein
LLIFILGFLAGVLVGIVVVPFLFYKMSVESEEKVWRGVSDLQ